MRLGGPKRRRLGRSAFVAHEEEEEEEAVAAAELADRLTKEGAEHAEAERYPAALRCFDQAVRHAPSSAAAHEQRSQVLLCVGATFDAVRAAEAAFSAAPCWGTASLTLARAQLHLGEPAFALASMERAIACGDCDSDAIEAEAEGAEALLVETFVAMRGARGPAELAVALRRAASSSGHARSRDLDESALDRPESNAGRVVHKDRF